MSELRTIRNKMLFLIKRCGLFALIIILLVLTGFSSLSADNLPGLPSLPRASDPRPSQEIEGTAKAEQVKAEQVKAEQVKAEQVKAEQVKAEQVKAEQVKAEQVKAEQVKAEQVKISKKGASDSSGSIVVNMILVVAPILIGILLLIVLLMSLRSWNQSRKERYSNLPMKKIDLKSTLELENIALKKANDFLEGLNEKNNAKIAELEKEKKLLNGKIQGKDEINNNLSEKLKAEIISEEKSLLKSEIHLLMARKNVRGRGAAELFDAMDSLESIWNDEIKKIDIPNKLEKLGKVFFSYLYSINCSDDEIDDVAYALKKIINEETNREANIEIPFVNTFPEAEKTKVIGKGSRIQKIFNWGIYYNGFRHHKSLVSCK